MRTRPYNAEVLYADESPVTISSRDIAELRAAAMKNPRQRIRICAHPGTEDRLHEMLIVLGSKTYIRPHKHPNKSESFHIVEGACDVVLFDDAGSVQRVIPLGDLASGKVFYYRLDAPTYHTLIVRSEALIVHETTNGPFNPADTVFAPWSPLESDTTACSEFMSKLSRQLEESPR